MSSIFYIIYFKDSFYEMLISLLKLYNRFMKTLQIASILQYL